MADFIEGKRAVVEALRTHVPLREIYMADNLKRDSLVEDILRKAKRLEVPVKMVNKRFFDDKSERGSHQGVMAHPKPYSYAKLQEIIQKAQNQYEEQGCALVVVLDHITDAGNLGAIARSAEIIGAAGMIIPNKRAARVTAATYKSSAGAISHLPVAQVSNVAQTLESLKKADFWVAGATEKASDSIWDSNLRGRMALVMGNEEEGLARLTREHCDFLVKLPQFGEVGSLNVAQAACACMYEYLRQNFHGAHTK